MGRKRNFWDNAHRQRKVHSESGTSAGPSTIFPYFNKLKKRRLLSCKHKEFDDFFGLLPLPSSTLRFVRISPVFAKWLKRRHLDSEQILKEIKRVLGSENIGNVKTTPAYKTWRYNLKLEKREIRKKIGLPANDVKGPPDEIVSWLFGFPLTKSLPAGPEAPASGEVGFERDSKQSYIAGQQGLVCVSTDEILKALRMNMLKAKAAPNSLSGKQAEVLHTLSKQELRQVSFCPIIANWLELQNLDKQRVLDAVKSEMGSNSPRSTTPPGYLWTVNQRVAKYPPNLAPGLLQERLHRYAKHLGKWLSKFLLSDPDKP